MKKTSGYFHIVLALGKMSIADLINLALALVYDTDPDYTVHKYTQAQLQAMALAVQTLLGNRLTDPHPTLTKQEQIAVDVLSRAILTVASQVTEAANEKAQGNRALFDIVVKRIGFNSAKAHGKHMRIWEITRVGKGLFHVIAPIEKGMGKPTYIFELAIASDIGAPVTTWTVRVELGNPEFYISGLPLKAVIAAHYAVTIIPSHKKKAATTGANTQRTVTQTAGLNKMITILPVNAHGKVLLTWGVPFIVFSDAIYIVVS
ncbi:MAG: hypothetical protein ACYDCN_06135 [Bacteroidia bacterium]